MELLTRLIIFPAIILIISILLIAKFSYIGALASSIITTAYFHFLAKDLNGYGNPTGYKTEPSTFQIIRDDAAIAAICMLIYSVITFAVNFFSR